MTLRSKTRIVPLLAALNVLLPLSGLSVVQARASSQFQGALTPFQVEIEKERKRLTSEDVEERRDAVMRLGAMRHREASRVATAALTDRSPIVRASAAAAVLSVPPEEAAAALIPNLKDKDEFVRQETAYALGKVRSRAAVGPLIALLENDKKSGVRGAAAVALGQIGDEAAVGALVQLLPGQDGTAAKRNRKNENGFVMRAAARSLGQIKSPQAVSALSGTVQNESLPQDVRREAAHALGLIGDPSATATLRTVLATPDPYLSRAAHEALRRIELQKRQQ